MSPSTTVDPLTNTRLSPFEGLAPEILQTITGFLPLSSACSLAFRSRTVNQRIGTRSWTRLRSQRQERDIFLILLGQDMPDYILCYHCKVLHKPSKMGTPCRKDRVWIDGLPLTFASFQQVMKSYHAGRNVQSTLDAFSGISTKLLRSYTYQHVSEARIVAGNLLIRSQHWVIVPLGQPTIFPPDARMFLCSHLVHNPNNRDRGHKRLELFAQCRIRHRDEPKGCNLIACGTIKNCFYCDTEFQFDVKDFPGHGTAIIITSWRNFGAGEHPADPKWRAQSRLGLDLRACSKEHGFHVGLMSSQFENGKKPALEASILSREEGRVMTRSLRSGLLSYVA